MKDLKELIRDKKLSAFVQDYCASDQEALGLLIAQYFEWDGIHILETLKCALEDANFHSEAEKIDEIIKKLEEEIK